MLVTWFVIAWVVIALLWVCHGNGCGKASRAQEIPQSRDAETARRPAPPPTFALCKLPDPDIVDVEIVELEQVAAWLGLTVQSYKRGILTREHVLTTAAAMAGRLESLRTHAPARRQAA